MSWTSAFKHSRHFNDLDLGVHAFLASGLALLPFCLFIAINDLDTAFLRFGLRPGFFAFSVFFLDILFHLSLEPRRSCVFGLLAWLFRLFRLFY